MIKSMTGFGRSELSTTERRIVIEIKSVNHRYCDMNIKMPKKLNFFEAAIRNTIKKYVQRGKVDIFMLYEDYTQNKTSIKYNQDIAEQYLNNLNQMSEHFKIENDIKVSDLAKYPDVFVLEEQTIDEKELWAMIEGVLENACKSLVEARISEGEHLKKDIFGKLDSMKGWIDYIEEQSPMIISEYKNKLEEKIKEALGDVQVDESRLLTEIVLYADKISVDEEITRLKSHIENTKTTLEDGDGIGRKLDFIAQELNREANTILSKANNIGISNVAIDLKTEIEKIREQIQNIE